MSFRENVDIGASLGRAMIVIIGAIAELERNLIVERVKAGLRRAKLEGVRIGRPPADVDRQAINSGCMIELLACPEHMDEQLRAMQEITRNTTEKPMRQPRVLGLRKNRTSLYRPLPHCECGCADADPVNVIGWCMWCDHVYVDYNRMTEDQHFARYCPDAPQELKGSASARLADHDDQ